MHYMNQWQQSKNQECQDDCFLFGMELQDRSLIKGKSLSSEVGESVCQKVTVLLLSGNHPSTDLT